MDIAILFQNPMVLGLIVSTLITMIVIYVIMMSSKKAHFTNCNGGGDENAPFQNIQDIIKLQDNKDKGPLS